MAAERVTAAERAGWDLEDLARQLCQVAELRGLAIPEGKAGARLAPADRGAVLALAELADALAAELLGRPSVSVASTAGELRRLLLPLPADAPILAPRADGWQDEAAAVVAHAAPVPVAEGPDGGWMVRRTGAGCRLVLVVVPRG